MTGMLEHETPGLGHNKPSEEDADEIKHGKWERWAKKRTFVRALEGTYSHLYKKLLEEPRVYSSKDHPWKGGPAMYGKHIISPQAVSVVQSIESHIECYAPLNAGDSIGVNGGTIAGSTPSYYVAPNFAAVLGISTAF